jgi:hypothetical protein
MKRDIPYIIAIVAIIAYLGYNHFSSDKYEKKIKEIILKDSLDTQLINKKILKLDSTDLYLSKSDSLLAIKIKNSTNNYKRDSKKYDQNKANMPILPDLGN